MLFNTFEYFIFFAINIFVYFILPRKIKLVWLLIASYFFYGSWNAKYLILMLGITLITYGAGLFISHENKTKTWLIICIALCIIVLCVFKYTNFLINNVNGLFGLIGSEHRIPLTAIVLPVGISFYVFQAISYVIDVYRDNSLVERNIIRYSLYISFFPQLVAGPIERSDSILKQLKDVETGLIKFDYKYFIDGLQQIVFGLFLKMVIADRVAILVDYVYGNFYKLSAIELILGMFGFSIQIYCDFCGYSLIACGSAQVMGIKLVENFKAPYFSRSVSEFWRRWHISLSSWFKDYIYIPLGGNRCSKLKNKRNIMITMLLSGLWHGAAWHFVAWGGVHGIAQVLEREIKERCNIKKKAIKDRFAEQLFKQVTTVIFISFAWILFRANSFMEAMAYITRMFTTFDATVLFSHKIYELGLDVVEVGILIFSLFIMIVFDWGYYKFDKPEFKMIDTQGLAFKWVVNIVLICFIAVFGIYGSEGIDASFIYFQF